MGKPGRSTTSSLGARTAPTVRPGHNSVVRAIASLNELPRVAFAEALRPLFEAAEPLANALYASRPFASYEELIERAEALANSMSPDDQVAVLSAHPRIGASPAELSAFSYRE